MNIPITIEAPIQILNSGENNPAKCLLSKKKRCSLLSQRSRRKLREMNLLADQGFPQICAGFLLRLLVIIRVIRASKKSSGFHFFLHKTAIHNYNFTVLWNFARFCKRGREESIRQRVPESITSGPCLFSSLRRDIFINGRKWQEIS